MITEFSIYTIKITKPLSVALGTILKQQLRLIMCFVTNVYNSLQYTYKYNTNS